MIPRLGTAAKIRVFGMAGNGVLGAPEYPLLGGFPGGLPRALRGLSRGSLGGGMAGSPGLDPAVLGLPSSGYSGSIKGRAWGRALPLIHPGPSLDSMSSFDPAQARQTIEERN